MEEREREYVQCNLDRLVRITFCSKPLLDALKSANVITDGDVSDLVQCRREKGSYAESSLLYRKCMKRLNGYKALINAMLESKQTEPFEILMDFYRTASTVASITLTVPSGSGVGEDKTASDNGKDAE